MQRDWGRANELAKSCFGILEIVGSFRAVIGQFANRLCSSFVERFIHNLTQKISRRHASTGVILKMSRSVTNYMRKLSYLDYSLTVGRNLHEAPFYLNYEENLFFWTFEDNARSSTCLDVQCQFYYSW